MVSLRPTEDEKMAGVQRLSWRYKPTESPVVVKGKEDYKRLKLMEAFEDADINKDGKVNFDELLNHLTKKAQQVRKDPTFQFNPPEVDALNVFFDSVDEDKSKFVSK